MSTAQERRYSFKDFIEFERQGRLIAPFLSGEQYTLEEYLEFERAAGWKYEYCQGEIREMPHVSIRHTVIVGDLLCLLMGHCKSGRYHVLASRMRTKVEATGLYTFPDIVIVDSPELEDENQDTLLNPTLIIEVLSEASEAYDRGEKFAHYRTIPTLREYVLVSEEDYVVEVFTRQEDNKWLLSDARGYESSVFLPSIECMLMLSEIYQGMERHPKRRKQPHD